MKTKKRKYTFVVHATVGTLIGGIVLAAAAMDMAWRHNTQQEIYSDAGINWGTWLTIGFSWFIGGCILFFIISIPTYKFIINVFNRNQKDNNAL